MRAPMIFSPTIGAAARIEPYGLMILIGLLIILPLLGSQLGINLNFVSYLISVATNAVIRTILRFTGNA
jgi:hypothetical protein